MAVRINALKIAFSAAALSLLIAALAVTGSFGAANAGAADVFVPGRVYTITGGKTTLTPTKRMVRKLKRAKVKVKPTGSARGGLRKLVFPVRGGRVNPAEEAGILRYKGSGFRFIKPIDKATPSPWRKADAGPQNARIHFVPAKVGLGERPVFTLGYSTSGSGGPSPTEELTLSLFAVKFQTSSGPQPRIRVRSSVRLTRRGARLLRSGLGIRVKPGVAFASLLSEIETSQSGDDEAEDS